MNEFAPYIIVGITFILGVVAGTGTCFARVKHLEGSVKRLFGELEEAEKQRDQALEDYMVTQMQLEDAKSALRISDGHRLSLMIAMAKRNNAILS